MIEACLDRVVPTVNQTKFGGCYGYRALFCDEFCHFDSFFQALLWRLGHLADKAVCERFFRSEKSCCVSKLTRPTIVSDNFLETLKSSNVSSKSKIYLFYRELSAFGTIADIGCGSKVDSSSNDHAIHCGDYWNFDFLKT